MASEQDTGYMLMQVAVVALLLALPAAWIAAAIWLRPRWKVAAGLAAATAVPILALYFYLGATYENASSAGDPIPLGVALGSLALLVLVTLRAAGPIGAKVAVAVLGIVGGIAWLLISSLMVGCRNGVCL